MPKLLTVAQAAEILGFSEEKVRTLLHQKKLNGKNHSTGNRPRWGISEAAIAAFINPQTTALQQDEAAPARKCAKVETAGVRTYY